MPGLDHVVSHYCTHLDFDLLAVSVDRYKNLSDPLNRFRRSRFMTRKRALIISLIIWLYSLLMALLPIMGWRTHKKFVYDSFCYVPFTPIYFTLNSILSSILPLLITCAIHIKIYLIASGQHYNFGGAESRKLRSNDEKKVYSRLKFCSLLNLINVAS